MRPAIFLFAVLLSATAMAQNWYKGTTHSHSLWSDGDSAPSIVAAWYKDAGYHFAVLSEHHILQEGERFVSIMDGSRFGTAQVQQVQDRFGEDWPEIITTDRGKQRMRLKTHEALSAELNEDERFLLIPGEEITTLWNPPHMNGINLREAVKPVQRGDKIKIAEGYIQKVAAQSEKHGVPMLVHLNHPNFEAGYTAEQIAEIPSLRFFEIFNAQRAVRSWGRPEMGRPPHERLWDIAMTLRLQRDPDYVLYGLGTDDCHDYQEWGTGHNNPGRGWVMVRAEKLDANTIVEAMQRGDFYASSGVTLRDLRIDDQAITLDINAAPDATYTTRFIGTRKGYDPDSKPFLDADGKEVEGATRIYSDDIGAVLLETTDNPAVYTYTGDELYVRAEVHSSEVMENPSREDDKQRAWTQPVLVQRRAAH